MGLKRFGAISMKFNVTSERMVVRRVLLGTLVVLAVKNGAEAWGLRMDGKHK